jgi:oxygen-independent coproporphyrinogen-3 oxidase
LALPDGSARRWWNVRTPERYCRLVEAGEAVDAAGETLDADQRRWEALALSLRTSRGVPASSVPAELFDEGLIELHEGDRAVLTPRGRLLANEVTVRLSL